MTTRILIIVGVLIMLFSFGSVHAGIWVSPASYGTASMQGKSIYEAKQEAMNEAMKKALREALANFISEDAIGDNESALRKAIYNKKESYIKGYDILSEEEITGNFYQVRLKANIDMDYLKNDLITLGLLRELKRNPLILVMIAEQRPGQDRFYYSWVSKVKNSNLGVTENAIMKYYQSKEFSCIDVEKLMENAKIPAYKLREKVDDSIALSLAAQGGAELVVVGKANAKNAGSIAGSNLISIQANVSARVLRVDTGECIGSDSVWKVVPHIETEAGSSKAFQEAGAELADKLMNQIIDKWMNEVMGSTSVQVDIYGINYSQLLEFKQYLENFDCVSKVLQKTYAEGKARLDVEVSKGDAHSLADRMHLNSFKAFPCNITKVTQNAIEVSLSGR
jgi:hypothetical protein